MYYLGENDTRKIQIFTICIINILILLSIGQTVVADKAPNIKSNITDNIRDFIRGVKVEFTPPPIIQNSGSLFPLSLTLTRTRTFRPIIFSIVIFMRLKDDLGRNLAVPIGFKPYVIFPVNKKSMTVYIHCITQHDLAKDASCLFINNFNTSCFNYTQGSIGVRIEKIRHGISEYLLWKTFVVDKIDPEKWSQWTPDQVTQFISFLDLISKMWKNSGMIPKFLILSSLYSFSNHVNARNKMIVWKDTKILPSFISGTDVSLKTIIDNKTDSTGHFKVNVTVINNMDTDINAVVLVDMSQDPFKNTFIPMLKGITIYNVGSWKCFVNKHDKNMTTILCSIPDAGFDRQYYTITVECSPYIFINNSNLYGYYFFDIRWNIGIKPHYTVSQHVTNLIQNMWYNTPIFYGEPGVTNQIFQTNKKVIVYNGNTSIDKIIDMVTRSILSHTQWLLLLIFLIVTPYVLTILRIYEIIHQRSRKRK